VDTRVLLVRNTATQSDFYVAGTVVDNVTTTATTSALDANLLVLGPSLTNRNPPPTGIKFLAVYKGRLVYATSEAISWSKIDEPEAVNPLSTDAIDSSGDPITGLLVDRDTLLILKDDRTFALNGDLGGAYTLTLVDANLGCVAHRTLVSAGGATYWWSRQGIVRYAEGKVERVGMSTYGSPDDTVSAANILTASAVVHDERSTIYFALPGTGQTRATFILPYNYALGVLEAELWDPMDVASLGKAIDSSGVLQPTLGGYAGQVFRLWDTNNDGVAASTTSTGSFVAGSASITTLTDAAATFDTTGGGLIERKITVLDAAGEIVTTGNRPRITSNTGTELTFTPALAVTSGATYTYVVGGPNFQFDTPWRDFGDPWVKKRFEYLFVLVKGQSYGSAANIRMAFDYDNDNINAQERTFASTSSGGEWDSALWDVDVWDSALNTRRRYRVARVARNWRVRFLNANANEPFALLYVAAQAVGQTVKD
jgi:hypothetical protein